MDYIVEIFFLGVDTLVLGFCISEYNLQSRVLSALKAAPLLSLDGNLSNVIAEYPGQKLPYGIIRGTVAPMGKPLKSFHEPSISVVVDVMKLQDHRTRGLLRFWPEHSKQINDSVKHVPFCLQKGSTNVEILDGPSSKILDLDVVYENIQPAELSFFQRLLTFVGFRWSKQTTEEVLCEGSYITAVGELETAASGLKLQPSSVGPMFLTTATKNTLIKRLEEAKSSTFVKILFSGAIFAIVVGIIGRKYYLKKRQERAELLFKQSLENESIRRQLRAQQRSPEDLPEGQECVVCKINPKEIIILDCGHVCLCENCAPEIQLNCPICMSKIERKMPAYYC